jgi:hypothetical protein
MDGPKEIQRQLSEIWFQRVDWYKFYTPRNQDGAVTFPHANISMADKQFSKPDSQTSGHLKKFWPARELNNKPQKKASIPERPLALLMWVKENIQVAFFFFLFWKSCRCANMQTDKQAAPIIRSFGCLLATH